MSGRTIALAGIATATIALGAALLASIAAGPPVHLAPSTPGDAYVAALDTAEGWPAPDARQRAQDMTVGGQICAMLSHGWNETGIVANMLTWPGQRLTQAQLGVAVHVTHKQLCGQST